MIRTITLIACFISVSFGALFAQNKTVEQLNQEIANIPYVFQGEIVDVEIYPGDNEGNRLTDENLVYEKDGEAHYVQPDGSSAIGYSIATIQICQIYKGNTLLSRESVQIVTSSKYLNFWKTVDGQLRHLYNPPTPGIVRLDMADKIVTNRKSIFLSRTKGAKRIFFCNELTKYTEEKSLNSLYLGNNWDLGISLSPYYHYDEKLDNGSTVRKVAFANGSGGMFKTQDDLNKFLRSVSLNTDNPNKCSSPEGYESPTEKKSVDSEGSFQGSNSGDYESNQLNYASWLERIEEKIRLTSNLKGARSGETLELEIANPRLTGAASSNPFLEFDILASESTGSSVYFDNCLMRIEYNTSAFGSNVVANGNIIITKASAYNTSTYLDPQANVIDQTSNAIGLPFGLEFTAGSYNRTALTDFPEEMLHVKIKIQNCGQLSDIDFIDVSFTPTFSFYTSNATDPITAGVSFDNTNYSGNINDNTCEPIITSFTDNIPAGIGLILTISGRYFGDSEGEKGTVIFKNANEGTTYPPAWGPHDGGIQSMDIVSWNHNEIQIKLPSLVDSVPHPITEDELRPIPGSGKFRVKNKYDKSKESATPLNIPYAVNQLLDGLYQNKLTTRLSGQDSDSGYTVHMHPDVEIALPGAREVIKKALKDWACVSGINWKLGNDSILPLAEDDDCVILMSPTFTSSSPELARAIVRRRTCQATDPGPLLDAYAKSFDIEINYSVDFQVDTTGNLDTGKYDFYAVIAHELGHAHLLEHANDSLLGIMFHNTKIGPVNSSLRKLVWLSSGAIIGAEEVAQNHASGMSNCQIEHTLSYPSNCSGLSIFENKLSDIQVSTYPNPISNGDLTVKIQLKRPEKIHFFLYDNMGKLIRFTDYERTSEGEYILPVSNLSDGVYFVQIAIGTKRKAVKFIKQ